MLENLQSINVFAPTISEIIINILVSLACSFFITFIYRVSYKGPGYSDSFVNSIIFLSLITSLVIMVIGNNLARAFGLVGAMSIIRFRTAIKETLDIVYIFFGLAIGMAAGVGYHRLAIVGSLFIGTILFAFSKTNLFTLRKEQYLLQFSFFLSDEKTAEYLHVFDNFCSRYDIINIKSSEDTSLAEYAYYVSFKKKSNANRFVEELRNVGGVKNINLFFDEEKV
ncbi:MAG: DUF4956 domain-containing protein [Ignavibacteria bacterium]|nr:DUF4956 domain-containing protein [Ignavibacteria bacterium]